MAGRVWVVGSLNVDRGWRVARHPRPGETVLGDALDPAPGGKGLNQAVAAQRMQVDVKLVGRVGRDADGRWLRDFAADERIDVSAVSLDEQLATGTALIVIDADGANTVTVDAGANAALAFHGTYGFKEGDVVVAQLEVPTAAVAGAFAEARRCGATSILNPSPIGVGRALVPDADIVVVNQHEAAELAGADDAATTPEEAVAHAEAIAGANQMVVVTLGGDGIVAHGPDRTVVLGGIAVDVVDTTGAGDCFAGVLAASLAGGDSVEAALDRANRAAALAVTRLGTVAAMPTAGQVDP